MLVKYSRTAQRKINELLISLFTKSPQQYKIFWNSVQNEFTSKYKDTIEEARIYIDEFRREIETTILNGKSIRRIRNDIGAGKDNYGVYIRHGNGWHIFFKKHKNHFTVVNLISSSYLHIDVKELYY